MRQDIRFISFDAVGTLFEVRGSVGELYERAARRYGVRTDARELDAAFSEAFQASPPLAFSGLTDADLHRAERFWWKEIVYRVFADRMPENFIDAYFEDVFELFRHEEAWNVFNDTRPSLARLKAHGYQLGVVSNFDSRLHGLLTELGLIGFFDTVVVSSITGFAKADPRIFLQALESIEVPVSQALHVGDSLQQDVKGAEEAGIQAVLLDRRRQYVTWSGEWRVENLEQLCAGLGV